MPFHYRKIALSGAQWRYCAKVGLAAGLGYLLTQGSANHALQAVLEATAGLAAEGHGPDAAARLEALRGRLARPREP